MAPIQKIQQPVTNVASNAVKKFHEYVGPGHIFSAKEIEQTTQKLVKPAEYSNPRSLIDSALTKPAVVDKAVVGSKLDIVEGHMFG